MPRFDWPDSHQNKRVPAALVQSVVHSPASWPAAAALPSHHGHCRKDQRNRCVKCRTPLLARPHCPAATSWRTSALPHVTCHTYIACARLQRRRLPGRRRTRRPSTTWVRSRRSWPSSARRCGTAAHSRQPHHAPFQPSASASRCQLLEPAKGSGAGKGEGFDVARSGDARVALIGFPSVGKSTLLSTLTDTESDCAAYEFTTLTCIPGNVMYKGVKIQVRCAPHACCTSPGACALTAACTPAA